ncbi:hypothetical protein EG329_014117 [Mollisiaceae sp. DMI_Dod_QoI]|nr:hypothetical protein EG329_014117 [Helotiales sp. DMI_Dod_QoI]
MSPPQAHPETKSDIKPTTPNLEISAPESIAIEIPNNEDLSELPENEIFPLGREPNAPNPAATNPNTVDDEISKAQNLKNDQKKWLKENELVLYIALAHLIAARNKDARKSANGSPDIIGKNIFTANSSSEDLAELYYHYNSACANVTDHHDQELDQEPKLPSGFREASAEERISLSKKQFAELMESPADNPWKKFNIQSLCERVEDLYDYWLANEVDDFMNPACFNRIGHFCTRSLCAQDDKDMVEFITCLEHSRGLTASGVRKLSDKDPRVHKATKNFISIRGHVEKALKTLEKHMAGAREKKHEDYFRLRAIYDGIKWDEDVMHLFQEWENPENGWENGVYGYIRNAYILRKFFYDLHLVQAAMPDGNVAKLPPTFCQFWGYEKLQRKQSAIFVKEAVAARQSVLLKRADYLGWHLAWYAQKEPTLKPIDPAWQWHIKMDPRNADDSSPNDPCTQMYNEYQKEAKRDDSLDIYMPPEFRATATDEERKTLTEKWIKEIIRPVAVHIFSEQAWKFSEAKLDKSLLHGTEHNPKNGDQVRRDKQFWINAETARQKLLSSPTIWSMSSATKEELALIPEGFVGDVTADGQRTTAFKYCVAEAAKLKVLIDHGLKLLIAAEGSYGTPGFRNSNSPAIRSAAKKAVDDKDGLRIIPLKGSLLCECENETEHKAQIVDDVAHFMCAKLDRPEKPKEKPDFKDVNSKVTNVAGTKEKRVKSKNAN